MPQRSAKWMVVLLPTMITLGCNWSSSSDPTDEVDSPVAVAPNEDAGGGAGANDAPQNGAADEDDDASSLGLAGVERESARNPLRELADPYYLVGHDLGQWYVTDWENSTPLRLQSLRGRVVVVRFWTDGSEDSKRSLMALQQLSEDFRGQPVTFVGIFLSQGSSDGRDWETAAAQARAWGVTFPLAYDGQWHTLNHWWRRRYDHLPATPSFVIGPDGRVVHLHPGPTYYPSDDPLEELCNKDFLAMREAIRGSLADHVAQSNAEG